jgi:hypothetical protein
MTSSTPKLGGQAAVPLSRHKTIYFPNVALIQRPGTRVVMSGGSRCANVKADVAHISWTRELERPGFEQSARTDVVAHSDKRHWPQLRVGHDLSHRLPAARHRPAVRPEEVLRPDDDPLPRKRIPGVIDALLHAVGSLCLARDHADVAVTEFRQMLTKPGGCSIDVRSYAGVCPVNTAGEPARSSTTRCSPRLRRKAIPVRRSARPAAANEPVRCAFCNALCAMEGQDQSAAAETSAHGERAVPQADGYAGQRAKWTPFPAAAPEAALSVTPGYRRARPRPDRRFAWSIRKTSRFCGRPRRRPVQGSGWP